MTAVGTCAAMEAGAGSVHTIASGVSCGCMFGSGGWQWKLQLAACMSSSVGAGSEACTGVATRVSFVLAHCSGRQPYVCRAARVRAGGTYMCIYGGWGQ